MMWVQRLAGDVRGITVLEYTLITVIFGAVVVAGVGLIGNALTQAYGDISAALAREVASL
jgi:Flp pilus assembly pilin Flp